MLIDFTSCVPCLKSVAIKSFLCNARMQNLNLFCSTRFLGVLINKNPSVRHQILAPKTLDFLNSIVETFTHSYRAVTVLIKIGRK
jgi:hypothetical protein